MRYGPNLLWRRPHIGAICVAGHTMHSPPQSLRPVFPRDKRPAIHLSPFLCSFFHLSPSAYLFLRALETYKPWPLFSALFRCAGSPSPLPLSCAHLYSAISRHVRIPSSHRFITLLIANPTVHSRRPERSQVQLLSRMG